MVQNLVKKCVEIRKWNSNHKNMIGFNRRNSNSLIFVFQEEIKINEMILSPIQFSFILPTPH